jgi:hypothetical protein
MDLSLLPSDVWYDILEGVARSSVYDVKLGKKNTEELANVGLTCRFIAEATRTHLFKAVEIQDQARCDSLLQLLTSNETLSSRIHHLSVVDGEVWARISGSGRGLWIVSESGRALMHRLSSISTLALVELGLAHLDIHEFASQTIASPLSSCTRLEIGPACTCTARDIVFLLNHAPRLQHLIIHNVVMVEYSKYCPMPMLQVCLPPLSTLSIGCLKDQGSVVVEQLVNRLRWIGRFSGLRKLSLRTELPFAMPAWWDLVRDASETLEEFEIEVHGGDDGYNTNAAGGGFIEAPQLRALTLVLGHPGTYSCDASTLDSCIALVNIFRPLVPLALTLRITVDRKNSEMIMTKLCALDTCFAALALRSVGSVMMVIQQENRHEQRHEHEHEHEQGSKDMAWTEKGMLNKMPQMAQTGILMCAVQNSGRRW